VEKKKKNCTGIETVKRAVGRKNAGLHEEGNPGDRHRIQQQRYQAS